MWRDIIAALGTVAVSLGGWEALKWLLTRRSNTRKASAEADKAGIEARDTALGVIEREGHGPTGECAGAQVGSRTRWAR